ncbi:MAG: glycogen/starch synthase [Muribaculaceae bacterium]|nr:glycogen/starch synthase [Muribaculaceae bacterium]
MYHNKVDLDILFETSWEVCNKVGGIYTVLSTKAKNLQKLYKDKVIFIGPDVWTEEHPSPYFTESKTLLKKWRDSAMFPEGVSVRVGRWEVPGRPIVVLVSFDGMYHVKDAFYGEMWEKYGVDSLHAYGDYDEACAFSHAAGLVIESIIDFLKLRDGRAVAHFDEWTTGMGLLYVKSHLPKVATIFTTHATSIGRSICGNGKNLYQYFKGYNGDQMAGELNMEAKHSLEKAAAHQADCFTTVSDITADECEQLLDRRPNVVTPNGFEENFVPGPRAYKTRRTNAREKIIGVVRSLTGVELDNSAFIIGTSGRCEYRNKGLDLYLDSVARLGELDPKRKVLALVMVPAWVAGPRGDLAHALALEQKKKALPDPVITHNLHNPNEDPVLNHIHRLHFSNSSDSRVMTVYIPCYLNGADGIIDLEYYNFLIGLDATVFPSYYEPWGYTPLESIAFGVPTVTTSLSGFGRWILSSFNNSIDETGVQVVSRTDTNYVEARDQIALTLKKLINATSESSKKISDSARQTSQAAAWDYFIDYYVKAFDVAFARAKERVAGGTDNK